MAETLQTPGTGQRASAALRSPFAGYPAGKHPNAAGTTGVRLEASMLPGVLQISTWISGMDSLQTALQQLVSELPGRTGLCCPTPLGLLMRTGPEELLLLCDDGPAALRQLRQWVAPEVGAVTDLSHARCRIRVEGPQCRATLNKLFALDLREAAFPTGELRLTGTHHVPCLLHRLGADRFDVLVFTTYAYDQLGNLVDAALEFGPEVVVP